MLSVITIFREEDRPLLNGILKTLPEGSEWLQIRTIYSENLTNHLELPSVTEKGVKIREITHYYKDFRFDVAKNIGIELANNEWCLVLDSDERLLMPEALTEVLPNIPENVGGLFFKVLSPQDQLARQVSNAMICRLFRKQFRFEHRIHEVIEFDIERKGFIIEESPFTIYHIGYSVDNETWNYKFKRNIDLMNKALALDNLNQRSREFMHSKLAMTYFSVVKNGGLEYEENGKVLKKTRDIL